MQRGSLLQVLFQPCVVRAFGGNSQTELNSTITLRKQAGFAFVVLQSNATLDAASVDQSVQAGAPEGMYPDGTSGAMFPGPWAISGQLNLGGCIHAHAAAAPCFGVYCTFELAAEARKPGYRPQHPTTLDACSTAAQPTDHAQLMHRACT